ncbi:DMT family transporter [Lentzea sp. PSKA42]|uniref:DMT family transporter n=1 Tax=Lentzea indica TaxID=2604800 RepID=A0ABX1FV51_9PSEU|nr:DMT family transporter [Lentzea indica]NKE62486.1 DMT family transporter [Lentzea indica]
MAAPSQDKGRVAAARLREIAGPELYRRNPFRVVGLATDAKPAQVRAQRHLLLGALDLGGTIPGDRRLPLPSPPSAQEVRAAFDALERPDHRLVDELFWWWGEPGACGCAPEVHEVHDIAVEAHAKALDNKTDDDLWIDAADAWMDALDDPRFFDHVRHRMKALSDRRMSESTVEGLRNALPKALLAPQVALAPSRPRLATLLDTWDVPAVLLDDAHRSAAEPTTARIDALVREVNSLLNDGSTRAAAQRADELPRLANLLETLAPHERYRWSAKDRNRVAVMLNNCGLALRDSDQTKASDLLELALSFVVEQRDREIIQDNMALPSSSWQFEVIQLVREGNKASAIQTLRQLQLRITDPVQRAQIDAMLNELAGRPAKPSRWPANLVLFVAFVAMVTICVVGALGGSMFASIAATIVLSWVPFVVIGARWYQSMMSGVVSFITGCVAFVVGWRALASLPSDVLEPFWGSALAFVVVSPFAYGVSLMIADWRNR